MTKHATCRFCSTLIEVRPWTDDDPPDWPRFHRCPNCRAVVFEPPIGSDLAGDFSRPRVPLNPQTICDLLVFVLPEDHPDRRAVEERIENGLTSGDTPDEDDLPPVSPIDELDWLYKRRSDDSPPGQ